MNHKKTAYLGLFAAVAIIFGYVESLIPFFAGIPGMKLGLANLAVLFILETYTWKEAAFVSVVRILVIGFLFGKYVQHSLQSGRGRLKSYCHDPYEKILRFQSYGRQRSRRRFP